MADAAGRRVCDAPLGRLVQSSSPARPYRLRAAGRARSELLSAGLSGLSHTIRPPTIPGRFTTNSQQPTAISESQEQPRRVARWWELGGSLGNVSWRFVGTWALAVRWDLAL